MTNLEKKDITVTGDYTEVHKAWMLWDWDNNQPLERDDGEFTVYFDPRIAEENRARTVTIYVHNEDGSEPDEEIYPED
jgi:hypothetical protein